MKKIMLIYPIGEVYQRGEDRCQINVNSSVANSLRPCNDLGYVSSILKKEGYNIFLKDYSLHNNKFIDFEEDIKRENPDVVFISITNGSIFNDIKTAKTIREIKKDVIIIFKGALFFNAETDLLNELDLSDIDYLIGGEVEFIIKPLLEAHYINKNQLSEIEGICYKKEGNWLINKVNSFNDNLDLIPFPDRELMENELYKNPLTNKPMATISTSRGCPSSCIYCLSPIISGKKVRFRSVQSVYEELSECVNKHKISDFFFKSDTFTINKEWVISLCNLIMNSPLNGKINWAANSRVNTIDEEMLIAMKKAGCSVIALGLESGSDESLIKMKKGTTIEQNIKAVNLIKKYGFKIWGFYIIGFPWETKEHLNQTKDLIFKLNTDFIELSIATPFLGSELYNMCKCDITGKDSFKYTVNAGGLISSKELEKFRKNVIIKYHLRISYILKKLFDKNITYSLLINYLKYGFRMVKNCIFNI